MPTHPSFPAQDIAQTDIQQLVLRSSDKVDFFVPALTLRSASVVFHDMFGENGEPIVLEEDSNVLGVLFQMICGKELPLSLLCATGAAESFVLVESLLKAADKYQMAGVLSILRLVLRTPAFTSSNPVWLYQIACRFGWKDDMVSTAKLTLNVDITVAQYRNALSCSNVDGTGAVRLFAFRWDRIQEFESRVGRWIDERIAGCQASTPSTPGKNRGGCATPCPNSLIRMIICTHAMRIFKQAPSGLVLSKEGTAEFWDNAINPHVKTCCSNCTTKGSAIESALSHIVATLKPQEISME